MSYWFGWTGQHFYLKCKTPCCLRKVRSGILHCCSPCATAHEGSFEIHEHSPGCDERAAERGAYASIDDALMSDGRI